MQPSASGPQWLPRTHSMLQTGAQATQLPSRQTCAAPHSAVLWQSPSSEPLAWTGAASCVEAQEAVSSSRSSARFMDPSWCGRRAGASLTGRTS